MEIEGILKGFRPRPRILWKLISELEEILISELEEILISELEEILINVLKNQREKASLLYILISANAILIKSQFQF